MSKSEAANVQHLGPLQETYTPDASSSPRRWLVFLAFFLWLGMLVAAIPFLPRARNVPPASPLMVWSFVLACALIAAGCVWRLRQLAGERRVQIMVHADGLARLDADGLLTCRWDDLESVQGIVYTGPKPFASHVIITIWGGQTIRTYWSKNRLVVGEALCQRVSDEICRRLLPRCIAAIEAGETVTFTMPDAAWVGGIAPWSRLVLGVSEAGLHWGQQVLPWGDPDYFNLANGFRVRSQAQTGLGLFRPWVRLEDIPVPNSQLLMRLVEHYLKQGGALQ